MCQKVQNEWQTDLTLIRLLREQSDFAEATVPIFRLLTASAGLKIKVKGPAVSIQQAQVQKGAEPSTLPGVTQA